MKTINITFALFLLAIGVNAQETKWQLSIIGAHDVVKEELSFGSNQDLPIGSNQDIPILYNRISQSNNFTAGFEINRVVTDRWTIGSGLSFSNKTSGKQRNNCFGCSNDVEIEQLHYLSIPLTAGYSLTTTRLRPIVRGGFVNNLLITGEFTEGRRFFVEWLAGIDLQYAASSRISALVGLHLRGATSSIFKQPANRGGGSIKAIVTDSFRLGLSYAL